MNQLFVMISILDRKQLNKFLYLYREYGICTNLATLGYGTAVNETLDYLGLEASEKAVITSVVTRKTWKEVRCALKQKMNIDIPGNGVAFIIPISSVGGKSQLRFLTGKQEFELKEESILQNTKYELLVIISNIGYSNEVMDAARKANAGGGTILHAKGSGSRETEHFLGITLTSEKEMIYIVVRSNEKNTIMKAIMDNAGLKSKAQAILFSLPVTSTAGMRFAEFIEQPEEDED